VVQDFPIIGRTVTLVYWWVFLILKYSKIVVKFPTQWSIIMHAFRLEGKQVRKLVATCGLGHINVHSADT